jgi:hypothetical protein
VQYQAVLGVARRQHDVITRAQTLEIISERTLHRWIRQGRLFEAAPRVYSTLPEPTWRSRVHAGTLSQDQLIVGFRTAARLWGFAPYVSDIIEFVGPPDAHTTMARVTVHESNRMPAEHITYIDGTRVTNPCRTIFDISATWKHKSVMRTIDNALDRKLITISQFRRTLEEMRRRGRRRTTILDEVLASDRYENPDNRSPLERDALELIKKAGLPEPVAQLAVPLQHMTLHPDLCYPHWRLAIELDGWDSHQDFTRFHDDRRRDSLLSVEDWRVERFSKRNLDLLVPVITAHIGRQAG